MGMKLKATGLLLFLILGQFLTCLFSTQKMWPFNPILVFVEPVEEEVVETKLVAFRPDGEADIVELGWVERRVEWRFSKMVDPSAPLEEQQRVMEDLAERLRPSAGQFEGLRLYNSTWNLNQGRIVDQKLVAEVRF